MTDPGFLYWQAQTDQSITKLILEKADSKYGDPTPKGKRLNPLITRWVRMAVSKDSNLEPPDGTLGEVPSNRSKGLIHRDGAATAWD